MLAQVKPGVSQAGAEVAEATAGLREGKPGGLNTTFALPSATAGESSASAGVSSANPGLTEAKPGVCKASAGVVGGSLAAADAGVGGMTVGLAL